MGLVWHRRFFAWFSIALFYAYQYIMRVLPNTFSDVIMAKFHVGAFSVGQFSGLYYLGYTVAHVPVGILLDRYGPKRVVPVCICLTALGILPMVFNSWGLVQLGRVLTGVGSAAAALSILKVSTMYFEEKFARMSALALIVGFAGAMYGGVPMKSLVDSLGWNYVFVALVAIGFVLALLSGALLSGVGQYVERSVWEQIKVVIFNKWLVLISILGGCMIGPLEGFADGWATVFLQEVCRLGEEEAHLLPSLIFIGSCMGSFVLSYLLEKSYNVWDMIIYCGVFTVIAFAVMFMGYCGNAASALLWLLVIGFCSAYQLLAVCKAIGYLGRESTALAVAVSNMFIMVFGYLFHTVIASVISLHWDSKVNTVGKAVYGADLTIMAILVVPVGVMVGLLGFVWLKHRAEIDEAGGGNNTLSS